MRLLRAHCWGGQIVLQRLPSPRQLLERLPRLGHHPHVLGIGLRERLQEREVVLLGAGSVLVLREECLEARVRAERVPAGVEPKRVHAQDPWSCEELLDLI